MNQLKSLLIIAAIIITVSTTSYIFGDGSIPMADKEYCDMVMMHKSTNGQYGWPDYNNNYNTVCWG